MLTSTQHVQKKASQMSNNEQVREYLYCMKNPFYFIFNYVSIPEIGGVLKYEESLMHSKMKRAVRSVMKYHKCLLMASRQLGKALDIETPIPVVSGGYKRLGDIVDGDWIFDGNGNPTQVVATTDIMNNRPCYQIEFDNNETIIADENHLWKISNSTGKFKDRIKTTKEIYQLEEKYKSWNNSASCRIELPDHIDYSTNSDLPIHPYALGLWLGDGAKDVNQITCHITDYIEYRSLLEDRGFEISDFMCRQRPTNESGRFTIYNIRPILREMNLLGNKHIPDNYLYTSLENRLELLRGIMDSDGCQMKNSNCNQFYQKDFNLLSQVRQLLSSIGIKSKYTNKIVNGVTYHQLTFTSDKYDFYNLERKCRSYKTYRNETKNVYIKSITPIESVPVRCIQVSNDDGMFLCGESMIPTHNSTIAACLLEWAVNFYPRLPATILNANKIYALENLQKVKFIHENLPAFLRVPLKFHGDRKTYLEYEHGSVLRTFYPSSSTDPKSLARSLTSPILYIDEAAFIRHMREAYGSAQPTLSRAREQAKKNNYPYFLLITSTPNGTVGDGEWFYNMHQYAIDCDHIFDNKDLFIPDCDQIVDAPERNGFVRVDFHWSEDPSKDEKWYQEQCRDLNFDQRLINQELDLLFVGSTNCIFSDEFLARLNSEPPVYTKKLPYACRLDLYTNPDVFDPTDFLLIGVDTAKSLTGDYNAIEVFSYAEFVQVGEFFGKLGSLTKYSELLMEVVKFLAERMQNRIILCIENNSIGSAIIENLENAEDGFNYEQFIYSPDPEKQVGINTNKNSRTSMISFLYDYIIDAPYNILSSDLITQLNVIERKANGRIEAQSSQHDDLFMAAALAAYVRRLSALEYEPLLGVSTVVHQQKRMGDLRNMINSSSFTNKTENVVRKNQMELRYNRYEGGVEYVDSDEEKSDTLHNQQTSEELTDVFAIF